MLTGSSFIFSLPSQAETKRSCKNVVSLFFPTPLTFCCNCLDYLNNGKHELEDWGSKKLFTYLRCFYTQTPHTLALTNKRTKAQLTNRLQPSVCTDVSKHGSDNGRVVAERWNASHLANAVKRILWIDLMELYTFSHHAHTSPPPIYTNSNFPGTTNSCLNYRKFDASKVE